jgi:DNA-directed RNA polymerase specialized sigma24 family protein
MLEIDAAYYKLNKEDRRLIFVRHGEAMDFKEIANVLSLPSEDASRMRYKRALNRLIRKLGGHKPYNDYDLPDSQDDEVDSTEDTNVSSEE